MHINKIALLEKLVNRICTQGTYTEHRFKRIGSRTQMRNGTQILKRMTFLLQRIIRCGSPFHGYLCCLDLKRLFCFRRRHQLSFYNDCCSDINLADFLIILQTISIYNLNRLKKGTIIHYNESKIFGITVTSYPSADRYLLIFISDRIFENLSDIY